MQMRTYNGYLYIPVWDSTNTAFIGLFNDFTSNSVIQFQNTTFTTTSTNSNHSDSTFTFTGNYSLTNVVEANTVWSATTVRVP